MKFYCQNHNGVWGPVIKELARQGHVRVPAVEVSDIALFWNDELPPATSVISVAQFQNIPTIVMPHSHIGYLDYLPMTQNVTGLVCNAKPIADHHLALNDFDVWMAKGAGCKNVIKIDPRYIWEEPLIRPDNIPDKFFCVFPSHSHLCPALNINYVRTAQAKADFAGLPLVVKIHTQAPISQELFPRAHMVVTDPRNDDHLGKVLWLLDKGSDFYIPDEQTANYLLKGRSWDRTLNCSGKIVKILEDIVNDKL